MSLRGYFDYNATTPMCQQAIDALHSALLDFGNPSSKYSLGNIAKLKLDNARRQVARLVGCDASELTFTSGGTEANNWAIKGALTSRGALSRAPPAHVVVSGIEHSSVLERTRRASPAPTRAIPSRTQTLRGTRPTAPS